MNRQQAVEHALRQWDARVATKVATLPRPEGMRSTGRYRKGQYDKLKRAGLCVY